MMESFVVKIGEGGCGIVFKGQVGEIFVVVKCFNKDISCVEKEFLQEVESIGIIYYVYFVFFLGYCVEGCYRMFVYEYVECGFLDRELF